MNRFEKALVILMSVLSIFILSTGAIAQQKDLRQELGVEIETKGVEAGIALYNKIKQNYADQYDLSADQLNMVGYDLLGKNKLEEAVSLFEFTVQEFKGNAKITDSLAEAYLYKYSESGTDKWLDLSEQTYQKALELNPEYRNPVIQLNKIKIIRNYDKQEFYIPMRDGVKLYTIAYIPKDHSQTYPVLLHRTYYSIRPYGEEPINYRDSLGPSSGYAESGYISVFQDARGMMMSEGDFTFMRPILPEKNGPGEVDESTDAYDTIEYLVNNLPANNGTVGVWGSSAAGTHAAWALMSKHPALKAGLLDAPMADWFIGDDRHHNGAFWMQQSVSLFSAVTIPEEPTTTRPERFFRLPQVDNYNLFLEIGTAENLDKDYFKGRSKFWKQIMDHEAYDDFWKSRNILPHLKCLNAAILVVSGWFDGEDLYGTLETYKAIEKQNPEIDNTIVMGPWNHYEYRFVTSEYQGELFTKRHTTAMYYLNNVEKPFFDYYLKDKGEFKQPEAMMFDTGVNEWKQFNTWPAASAKQIDFYLNDSKALTTEKPAAEKGFDEYISDPENPVPHVAERRTGWTTTFMHANQYFASRRPDVVEYQTQPLSEDMILAGPTEVELYVSTTGTDADWVVKIIDVYPENADQGKNRVDMSGYQRLIRGDVFRGKFRNSFEHPEPFVPGEVTCIKFKLQDILHTFRKGHRIMVQVQSSWFPVVDRNPQTFCNIYKAKPEDFQKATQRIYRNKLYSSKISVNKIN